VDPLGKAESQYHIKLGRLSFDTGIICWNIVLLCGLGKMLAQMEDLPTVYVYVYSTVPSLPETPARTHHRKGSSNPMEVSRAQSLTHMHKLYVMWELPAVISCDGL
jgi:hypothetical protein